MTKEELDVAFFENSERLDICSRIICNSSYAEREGVQERASIARDKLLMREAQLEQISKDLTMNEYIAKLEKIEKELG